MPPLESYPHLQSLNPAQLEAVSHKDGPILILAGAGSGKTRVLTNRVAHLVLAHKVPVQQILAVTFTNKATEEMQKRLRSMLGADADDLWVSTFHSAALRVLRRHARELGFTPDFSVYDEQDSKFLMKGLLKELGFESEKKMPQAFLNRIDRLKSDYILPEDFRKIASQREQKTLVVYEEYQKALFRSDAMDFGDLLMHAVTLLKKFPALLESYRRKLHYILVDEYQDTNHVQYLLLTLLGKPRNNVLVVGDDDQAIYSFRGADIRNILDFEKDFPGAKIVRLEENYRSTAVILRGANEVIAQNQERKGKELWTSREGGELINLFAGSDETAEAQYICRQLFGEHEKGTLYRDMAVFYRTNAQSRALEESLIDHQIPYRIFGGLKFYDRKEIKDILAYLKLLLNPSDEQAFLRIVNVPARGIGPKTLQSVAEYARERGISLMAAAQALSPQQKGLAVFVALIAELRAAAASLGVADLIDALLEKTAYLKSLQEMKDPIAESRIENIKELRGVAWGMSSEGKDSMEQLKAFLDRVALASSNENPENVPPAELDYVSLMTLHVAKGLEFSVVFLSGMEEGLIPHHRSLGTRSELEEERRLCYVGMTRAMNVLHITRAETRSMFAGDDGGVSTGFYRYPSRFIKDIPVECINEESMIYADGGSAFSWAEQGDDRESLEQSRDFMPVAVPKPAEGDAWPRKSRSSKKANVMTEAPKNMTSGMRVFHPTFGKGIVDRIDGDPEHDSGDAVITVQFDDFEEPMKLIHKYSRLSFCE